MNAQEKQSTVVVFTENGLLLDAEAERGYYDEKLMSDFKTDPYGTLLHFGFEQRSPTMSHSLTFLHSISAFFIEKLSKRSDIEIADSAEPLTEEEIGGLLLKTPYAIGSEFVGSEWMETIWAGLSNAFESELMGFEGDAAQYLLTHSSNINVAGRVFFHLVENKSESHPFAFLATYSRRSSEDGKTEHVPLKNALLEYGGDQKLLLRLLSTVSKASEKSDFISELVESGELFSPLRFTAEEAYVFLKEIPLYEECGIMCRMPDWWKRKYNTVGLDILVCEKQPSSIGLEALIAFDPELSLCGEKMTREELENLILQTEGLSLIKGKWVEIDHEKLRTVLEAYDRIEKMSGEGMSLKEALRFQMGLSEMEDMPSDIQMGMSNGEWLSSKLNDMRMPEKLTDISAGDDFTATLRQYQQVGLNWLTTMSNTGFGALLADDMGLGKTVQVLAFLEHMRQNGGGKTLLIIPASLIGNWKAETERFAPNLRYCVLHGNDTEIDPDGFDLFITTYGMTSRIEKLKGYEWDTVILDEAQAIKNPGTKQTKAVKAIPARFHVAMTGTPVENKMSDLWSIFDFLNNGLLGTPKEFSDYAKALKDNESYAKLRNIISPFILRRLKTDKSIISDLPEKIEMKTRTSLTKKQVALYSNLVNELSHSLEDLEGIERKGIVLAGIMKFKQICNHPDQFLGQGSFEHSQSGKFEMLNEICGTINEKRERVLVFTQFRELCDPLSDHLEKLFGKRGLVLHGGTSVKKRAELVDIFNGDEYIPYMVLSLKAGGVGLNLTAANHVIHFDRWWNPAVENQATDRAFRIGQKKNVLVHKFVTAGTIEEKIDMMIEDKLKLSGELISSGGENWITELSNEELKDLFRLET